MTLDVSIAPAPSSPRPRTGRTVAYLSGAPRVSTRSDAAETGARRHVLGTISGFEQNGWRVDRRILGDRLGGGAAGTRAAGLATGSRARRLLGDVSRIGAGSVLAAGLRWAPRPDLAYERLALLQGAGRALQRRGVPWVLETNGVLSSEAAADRDTHALVRLGRRREVAAYRDADLVVVVSDALRDEVVALSGIDVDSVVVVPNGVDVAAFPVDPVVPAFSGRPLTLGFVGVLYPWQGLDLLVEAMALLRDEGVDLRLRVAGDGPGASGLRDLVQHLGLGDRVELCGRVHPDEVPTFLRGIDVGYSGQRPLAASAMYHSPLKLYEYVAACRPFVASAYPDAHRLAGLGGSGYTFVPGDVDDLVGALRRCAADQHRWVDSVLAARRELERTESWGARVRTLLGHLDDRGLLR